MTDAHAAFVARLRGEDIDLPWWDGVPSAHVNLALDDYHKGPGISRSGIMAADKSVADFRHYLETGVKETRAMLLGSATHAHVLEPMEFGNRYAEFDPADHPGLVRTLDDVKDMLKSAKLPVGADKKAEKMERLRAAGVQFQTLDEIMNDSARTYMSRADLGLVEGMGKAVRRWESRRWLAGKARILGGCRSVEESFYWRDERTGIILRTRPDTLESVNWGWAADLKTTGEGKAKPWPFEQSVYRWGLDVQAAMGLAGIEAVTGHRPKRWYWVIVESEPIIVDGQPRHKMACYAASERWIERGRIILRRALDALAAWCDDPTISDGYPEEDEITELPMSRWRALDDEDDDDDD